MKVFTDDMYVMMGESDRGAVLVGLSVVDQHLRKLIEHGLPEDMRSKNVKDRLFEYPGPFSSVSAKADIARATSVIGAKVYKAITRLRQLRNVLAHEPDTFHLEDHRDALHAMSNLGDSMPEFIEITAQTAMTANIVSRLKDLTIELPDTEPTPAFSSPQEVIERIQEMPDLMATLREKVLRMQLGLAVGYICGFLAAHREMPITPKQHRSADVAGESNH